MTLVQKLKEEFKKTLNLFETELADQAPQLQISEMVVGGKVEIINSDGSLSPAEDGEYTVEEDVIVVKDGLIESINGNAETPQDSNSTETEPTEMADDISTELADLKAQVEEMKTAQAELKTAVEELKNAIAKNETSEAQMSSDFTNQLSELTEAIKTIATTPAQFSQTNDSNLVKDARKEKEEKMKELAGRFSSIRK